MEKKTLAILLKSKNTKRENRRLRREGKIPAVIYGKTDSQGIIIDENEFNAKFPVISESIIINLKGDSSAHDVLIKDYQEDIITGRVQHIDFYEIERGKILRTHAPVHFKGTSIGVMEGGVLDTLIHELEVECLPKDLPEEFLIDISALEVGDSIHVRDIEPLEGVRMLTSKDQVLCIVEHRRAEEVVEVAEEEVEEEALEEEEEAESSEE
jgi:large subunit ribosomal protein L25